MGRTLQKLYDICGALAGGLIICICLLISTQIILNATGRLSPGLLPSTIPTYAGFSGFMLAGATFLALAHTLRAGGHIRVNLVTARLPDRPRTYLEGLVLIIATILVGYVTWFMIGLVAESVHYGDVSHGIIPIAYGSRKAYAPLALACCWWQSCIHLSTWFWLASRSYPRQMRYNHV
ncbi:MAG: TRAP transporter small permease [Rhodobacteraceae bacterium]|nr:TRAP transporter small permease [Paracoccaceae bacterium]MBL4813384.1 TRAP transporter small permease [Paracoccaceae bacterium]